MAVPPSVVVASCLCIGASACVSSGLTFCATFAVSLILVARELSPDQIDGALAVADAFLRREARYHEAQTWRLRDAARRQPFLAFLYATAERGARRAGAFVTYTVDRLKTTAEPKWLEITDGTAVALSWIRLTACVINLAVAVLTTTAERQEAASNTESDGDTALASSSPKPDDATLFVAWVAVTFTYSTLVFFQCAVASGMASLAACFACFATLCFFALMQARKVYQWSNTASLAGVSSRAWELLWSEIILVTYFVDAYLLCVDTPDTRPVALAFLAACNVATLRVARQVEAQGSAAAGFMIRWRAHATAVCAMGVAKVFVVCLVLGFHPGALGFAFLCGVIALLLNKAISSLPDAGDAAVAGDGEVPAYVAAEDPSTRSTFNREAEEDWSSSAVCDRENEQDSSRAQQSTPDAFDCEEEEDSSFAAACGREEEDKTSKENFDGSDSDELQRQEEQNYSDGCMDEWNLVETDPVMPINVNGGANGNGKFKRWPRKYSYLRRVL